MRKVIVFLLLSCITFSFGQSYKKIKKGVPVFYIEPITVTNSID
jgi:hypothetical protein